LFMIGKHERNLLSYTLSKPLLGSIFLTEFKSAVRTNEERCFIRTI